MGLRRIYRRHPTATIVVGVVAGALFTVGNLVAWHERQPETQARRLKAAVERSMARDRARAQAADPAPSSASEAQTKEALALLINVRGFLCAEVREVRPLRLADTYEVQCIEYRGGSHKVKYVVNARRGQVERL